TTGQGREPHSAGSDVSDVLLEHHFWASGLEHLEVGDQRRPLPLEAWWVDVEQGAAADRHDRRIRAHDEAVARPRDQWRLETEPGERRLAWYELRSVEQERARHDLTRSDVEAHARTRLHRARRVGQELERAVHQRGGDQGAGPPDDVASLDRRPLEPLKIDRGALAG